MDFNELNDDIDRLRQNDIYANTYDYQLYKLLDVNGYVPSSYNLKVLKQKLMDGGAKILDANKLIITENCNENVNNNYFLFSVLSKNNYKTTVNNLKILRESLDKKDFKYFLVY